MKIGITERGDAGLDFGWVPKIENDEVDGAILVTKNLNNKFIQETLRLHNAGKKLAVYCGCTGWGGTWLEPHVPTPEFQLTQLAKLINAGFPSNRCTLRIDPIIPNAEGIERARHVLRTALATKLHLDGASDANLLITRYTDDLNYTITQNMALRISIYDEYRHVKERLATLGRAPFYKGNAFQADDAALNAVLDMLWKELPYCDAGSGNFVVETCAEPKLVKLNTSRLNVRTIVDDKTGATHTYTDATGPILTQLGCISKRTLRSFGIPITEQNTNPQNRFGCSCLQCKTELLTNKKQCPHKCVYCYWR